VSQSFNLGLDKISEGTGSIKATY